MPLGLTEAIAQGSRDTWATVGVFWLASAIIVLAQRGPAKPLRVVLLLALASATGLAALALANALSVPRLSWRTVDEPVLIAQGGDTLRSLRGPVVRVHVEGLPDLGVPTVDGAGRWVLYALLAARPVASLPPATAVAPEPGGPRLCTASTEPCRAWPAAWPTPTQAHPRDALTWSALASPRALAYDPETRHFLHETSPESEPRLELVGSLSDEPTDLPNERPSEVFALRRLSVGRLDAVRVVHLASPTEARYITQRASSSLRLGPLALRLARPLLIVIALALPLGGLAMLTLPTWLAKRRETAPSIVRASLSESLRALAVLAIGLALALPALVVMVSLLAAR